MLYFGEDAWRSEGWQIQMDIWEKKLIRVNSQDALLGDLSCDVSWQRETLALNRFTDVHSFFLEVGSYELIGDKSSHRFNFSSALSLHQLEMPEKEKDHSAWVSLRMTKLLERCRRERQVQPWDAFSEVLPMQGRISSSVVHWMRPCGDGNTAYRFG